MSGLLYIHGFLSSPRSEKARMMGKWLESNRPDIDFYCPFLTPHPHNTRRTLESLVEEHSADPARPLYLVGSSLGGFWATWLAEKYDLKAVLINPVVELGLFKNEFIDIELKNYHTEDSYILEERDIEVYAEVFIDKIKRPQNYMLLLQTGDDVLDYRQALEKYPSSRRLVENGGDHGYQGFDEKIDIIMGFFENGN